MSWHAIHSREYINMKLVRKIDIPNWGPDRVRIRITYSNGDDDYIGPEFKSEHDARKYVN